MIHIIYHNISYTINAPDRHGHDDTITAILFYVILRTFLHT